jgi:ribosomal protein S18
MNKKPTGFVPIQSNLQRFMSQQGKILSRRLTGLSAKEQRKITRGIKQARLLGFCEFVNIHWDGQ